MTTGKTYRFQQGLNQWVRVACAVVLLSAASSARAQVADSTDIPLTSIDNDGKSAVFGATPQELQLQDNYRPRENDYLFPKKAWRRLQVGFGAGVNWINDNQDAQHQSTAHLNLTYRFTPVHALRFNASSFQYRLAPDATGNKGKAPAIGLGFDYLANLTNFAGGYDPSRMLDVSLVTGVGTRFAKKGYDMGKGIYPYGKMGLQLDFNVTKNVGLYVEPYVGLTKKMEQVLGNSIPERWNLFYGIQGGMKASFEDTGRAFAKSDTVRRKMFFDSSIGWTSPSMNSNILSKSGAAYQVALGKWMNPLLGFRVGVQGQSFFYSKDPVMLMDQPMTRRKEEVMLSARGELMFDLPNAFAKWREVAGGHNFDMNVLFGGEYGWVRKSHQPGDSKTPGFMNEYYGVTGAMQFLYRINNPGTYIFVEPRYLGAFYKNQYEPSGKHVRDDLYTISVGTRIYITNPSFRPVPRIDDYRNWWMAMDLGGMKWQRSWIYTHGSKLAGINPSLSLSVGYDLARLASFRAQLNYQHLSLTTNGAWKKDNDRTWGWGVWDNNYNLMDLRLSYMMNLNNLLQGYRADRRYSLWWTVGPSFSYVFAEKDNWLQGTNHEGWPMEEPKYDYKPYESVKGHFSPGIATSLMSVLALNKKVDLTVEAMGQYNFNRDTNPGYRSKINSVKYGLSIGTRYHFVPGELKSGSYRMPGMFFDASTGWTFPTFGKNALQKSGIAYQAALGKWLHPVLGFRLGASAQSFIYTIEPTTINGIDITNNKEQVLLAGRGELILNPLNFASGWRNKEGGHDFEFNLLAGAEFGWNRKSHLPGNSEVPGFHTDYKGITAAAQLMYRINNPGTYIYLEPRVLNAHYNDPYYFQGTYKAHDNLYSLSVGTRVYMMNRAIRRAATDSLESHWWMAFDLGGAKWQRSYSYRMDDNNKFHPAMNFSLGYDWKKLASFRATLAYQRLSLMDNPYSQSDASNTYAKTWVLWNSHYNVMDIRLAYMLNINNLFQGYNRDRRYNFYWTIGPAMTYVFYQKDNFIEGQDLGKFITNDPRNLDRRQGNVSPAVASTFLSALSVSDNVDLTMEALGQYNFIKGTNPGERSTLNNVKYGITLGARYHLRPGQLKSPLGDNRRMFFDSSYGWNTPTFGNGFLHQSGHSYQMAIGKWFHPAFGARIGASGQTFLYSYTDGTGYTAGLNEAKEEVLLGGRAEAIFAPFQLFAGWRNKEDGHVFDLNLSAGAELGWMRRSHYKVNTVPGFKDKYKGITAAAQLLFRVNTGTYVFVEPRVLHTNFDEPNNAGAGHDNVYTLSVGTRVHLAAQDIRRSHDEFTPNLWMGLNLGGMKWQRSMYIKQGGLGVNPSLTASVGYDWKKFATFRAQLNYQHFNYTNTSLYTGKNQYGGAEYSHGVWNNDYNAFDLRLSYMLNVNNLFQGYKADRKFNLWWTAGPAMTYIFHDKSTWVDGQAMTEKPMNHLHVKDSRQGKVSPAVATSLMTQLQVAPKWDITCEAMGQYNFIWGTNPGFRGRINNVKYDFSVGTRYHF